MTPRNLFNIIIKIFGLFFLKEVINIIPQTISSIFYIFKADTAEEGLLTFIISILVLLFYLFISYCLIFKTNYFLNKLKLEQVFTQREFSFDISTSKVLTIALIVLGGVILVNEIPNFCRDLFAYFQEKSLTRGFTKPDFSFLIASAVKIIVGLLLIGERNRIIEYIAKKTPKEQSNE